MLQEEKTNTYQINPLHMSNKLKTYAKEHEPLLHLLSELR